MFKKINVYFEMWDFGSEKLHIATARFSCVFLLPYWVERDIRDTG